MSSWIMLIGAYFWGGIPTAYILSRWRRGIDIRNFGTGNVGAANVVSHLGWKSGLGVGVFDGLIKGTLPILVARLTGFEAEIQVGVALLALAGHNWSPYIKFTGGRGIALIIGIYVGFGLWIEILAGIVVACIIGWALLRNLPLWTILGLLTTIMLSVVLNEPREIVLLLEGLTALTIIKRLFANWTRFPPQEAKLKVLIWRLIYDRDVADRSAWVNRRPFGG